MSGTIQRFERLAKEAAGMEHDVAFAKALHSVDPELWLEVTAESWDAIFSRFQGWTELYKAKTEVPIPEEVKKADKCSLSTRRYMEANSAYHCQLLWIG